jgi:hypothetical protein
VRSRLQELSAVIIKSKLLGLMKTVWVGADLQSNKQDPLHETNFITYFLPALKYLHPYILAWEDNIKTQFRRQGIFINFTRHCLASITNIKTDILLFHPQM